MTSAKVDLATAICRSVPWGSCLKFDNRGVVVYINKVTSGHGKEEADGNLFFAMSIGIQHGGSAEGRK
jgi:hypothetical protein